MVVHLCQKLAEYRGPCADCRLLVVHCASDYYDLVTVIFCTFYVI